MEVNLLLHWFERLSQLPEEVRASKIKALQQRDPILANELHAMFLRDSAAESYFELPASDTDAVSFLKFMSSEFGPDLEKAEEKTIQGYRLVESLGSGKMGRVFRAICNQPFYREVALKFVPLHCRSELQALCLLNHDNIVKLFETGKYLGGMGEKCLFFTMEYLEGAPLDMFCDVGCLSLRERLQVLCQVCQGLSHAHARGVIHGDVKPGNILVQRESDFLKVKIIDFGVAKVTRPDGVVWEPADFGLRFGTPAFVSPEWVKGAQTLTPAMDIFSMGILLFYMVTGVVDPGQVCVGQVPFVNRHFPKPSRFLKKNPVLLARAVEQMKTCPEDLLGLLRKGLDQIIDKALAISEAERFGSIVELRDELKALNKG